MSPKDLNELAQMLACASHKGEQIGPLDLSAFDRVLEHRPEDMTVTVEAGLALDTLQAELRKRGQWLPIDPPPSNVLTVGSLLSENNNGPRRLGYGTIRDWLIGIRVALADGTLIRSGGKVVKNVAGYDLMKIFVGHRGSLGVIVEATFKLRPLPEAEAFVEMACDNLETASATIDQVINSNLCPTVFDLHHLTGDRPILVIGFDGTTEEVAWQLAQAKALGLQSTSSLQYNSEFWSHEGPVHTLSVLPSRLMDAIRSVEAPFVARAGNGIIYHRGNTSAAAVNPNRDLMNRLKTTFDPRNVFPDFPFTR